MSDSYKSAVKDFINYTASKQLGVFENIPDKKKYYQTEFRILDSLLAAYPYTKERMKAERILFIIKYFDLPQLVQAETERYKTQFPSSAYVALIQKKRDQKNENVLTIPAFRLKDQTGKNIDVKSLRGKVVYIDFWGSWCKPCVEQMPNSELLQKQFKGKAVCFMFIDFYDTKQKWLATIIGKQLKGLHLKAEKQDVALFDKTFGVKQGFPRYALLDKNGFLITTSAPFPNDSQVVSLIDKYLK